MSISDVLDSIISFAQLFTAVFFNLFDGLQWFFTNASTVINSFFSLLSFCRQSISFLSSFSDLVPTWLLPFILAYFAYCLIMFIIKLGGKE